MDPKSRASALSPVARTPLYEQLMEQLRAFIVEAGMVEGQRLPPERELAERLGVSRASVRQAIVALEVQGVVEVRHGEGAFLRVGELNTMPLADLMEIKRRLPDILDAREAIEVKLAALAAQRHTDNDIAACTSALTKMQQEIAAGQLGEGGDQEFHQSVVRAANSPLLERMYEILLSDIATSRRESLGQVGRPPESLKQHRRIFQAIQDGDALAAAEAMRDHLKAVRVMKVLS